MLRYHDDHGDWPSHREMAEALGIRSSNLSAYLDLLEAKGLIARLEGRSRRNRGLTELGRTTATEQEWQPRLL